MRCLGYLLLCVLNFSVHADIFSDGTVNLVSSETVTGYTFNCVANGGSVEVVDTGDLYQNHYDAKLKCFELNESIYQAWSETHGQDNVCVNETTGSFLSVQFEKILNKDIDEFFVNYIVQCENLTSTAQPYEKVQQWTSITISQCPPALHPSYTYSVNGSCADPSQIDLVDSCNGSTGNFLLDIEVTESQGCFTQPDGSICPYTAVYDGSGSYYSLDLEESCYTSDLPSLDSNQPDKTLPNGDCLNDGGLFICPEDPENVCNSSGVCQSGCGYVNDQFVCFSQDTDNDGLADYKDPDIDGDGISNDLDLDADGDGQQDASYNPPSESQTGTFEFDDSRIVDAIEGLTENQEFQDGSEIGDLIEQKQQEYDQKAEEFFDSESMTGIEGFTDNNNFHSEVTMFSSALSGTSCTNPTHSAIGDFDICSKIVAVRPYLYIIFALMTFIFCFYRFGHYVKGGNS